MVTLLQRIENGAIAIAILVAMIAAGLPWWALLAAFVAFDLSALGYARNPRTGALFYNLVHNYTGPAICAVISCALLLAHAAQAWITVVAACWGFHVAVDRMLGYGLKLDTFTHTHLGVIGRARSRADGLSHAHSSRGDK